MKEKKMKEKKIIWRQVRLGEVAELKNGYAFKSETYATGDYRIITIANVQNGYLDMSAYNTIPQIPFDIQRHQVLQVGDILVSMTGNVGRVCKVDIDNCLLNQRVGVLVKKSKDVADTYLYAVLNTPMFEQAMINAGQGAAQQNIGKRNIEDYCIPVPFDEEGEVDMEEQRRIAGILSDMDEEIRVKEELLAKHRALKQGVMQQLLSPDAVTLSPDVAGDATASTHTHTQRRRELVKLGEICSIIRGGSPRPIEAYLTTSPNGYNWIKIGDVKVGAKYIERTEEKINAAGLSSTRIVRKGDFILSNSMSFGRPYILKIDGCIHDGWLAIQDYKATCDTDYLYYILSSEQIMLQYKTLAAGSSVLNLNKNIVSSVLIPIPCKEDGSPDLAEQRRIAGILSDMDAEIGVQEEVIEKLKAVKQGVMQGLLNAQQRA